MRRTLVLVSLAAACGDPPPPVEVSNGRLVAVITPEPAQIELVRDGVVVWSTRAGGQPGKTKHDPPHGFAATGSRATEIEMQFGAFKFTELKDKEVWRPIDTLGDVLATDIGATFTLRAGDDVVGRGRIELTAEHHARIVLETDQQRISLASPTPADEHMLGLGGQSFDIDHKGETVPLFVQEDGIGKLPDPDDYYAGVWFLGGRKHTTHTPMPMMLSNKGYALAVKTDARAVFALGSEKPDSARYEAWEGTLDLHVFVGEPADPKVALGHMIAWVGKAKRPPLAIFAPWVDAIFGSDNVRRVAQKLRDNGISASAIWTEDFRGGEDTFSGYSLDEDWRVDADLYPDFDELADDLHGMGFQFLTYHNTFVDEQADVYAEAVREKYVVQTAAGEPYLFTGVKFHPTALLDLSSPAARTWAKGVMGEVIDRGSDGFMADFAEWLPHDAVLASGEDALAVHNRYPVDWLQLTNEILAPRTGRLPTINFVRAAWIGSQPHAQVVWAGDQQTDFSEGDGIGSVIPMGLNLGLAGFPYFGSDIAGYMSQSTIPTTEELFYRWVTFGALQPVMRTHHGRSARDNFQWENDAAATAHFRRYTRFHMQLAAYLSGSIGSYERDGLPLFRLIALAYPAEPWAWTDITQYLLGDRILVAPVIEQGAASRTVTLPAGTWYPLLGGTIREGGEHDVAAPITEIPAFVPQGSILVLYPDGVDTPNPAPQLASAVTVDEVGGDREVWLYHGTAADPAHAQWNDTDGPAGPAQWAWTGRDRQPMPTTATFNGTPVTLEQFANGVVATVTGDGTLAFNGGGTLTIARGDTTAVSRVVLRAP